MIEDLISLLCVAVCYNVLQRDEMCSSVLRELPRIAVSSDSSNSRASNNSV